MPWIRLSDNYMDDEKIDALSDGAFRLWHAGLAYCRRNQTDGVIPFTIMRRLSGFTKSRERELATKLRDGVEPLWHLIPALGYRMHNYLEWNPSKEQENGERAGAASRMRRHRERYAVTGSERYAVTLKESDGEVPDRIGSRNGSFSEKVSGEKPDPFVHPQTTDRAARFLDRYQALYVKHRNGARYALKPVRDYAAAVTLCHTWDDDARLDKLAVIFLTTDHKFAEEGSRTVPQFLALASWCDGKLAEHEAKKAAS